MGRIVNGELVGLCLKFICLYTECSGAVEQEDGNSECAEGRAGSAP